MRTRIINRGGFRWFNDRNATSIPRRKNLCRWWVNFEPDFTTTSKIRTIVVRIGGVETVEFETSTIKDKDLARIFFFLSSIFFPSQRIELDVHYFHHQFIAMLRGKKFRGKEPLWRRRSLSWVVKIGISRIMELLVQPFVLKCVAINRSKSKRGRMLLTARPSSFSIQFVPLWSNYIHLYLVYIGFLC